MCQETAELHPLGATVVTVGVNVGGYSGAALDVHFKDVASRDDLYLKIEDINGPGLDDMITELLVSVFGRCGVTCGRVSLWSSTCCWWFLCLCLSLLTDVVSLSCLF